MRRESCSSEQILHWREVVHKFDLIQACVESKSDLSVYGRSVNDEAIVQRRRSRIATRFDRSFPNMQGRSLMILIIFYLS